MTRVGPGQGWIPHHWFRGACLYGVMPANGLIYAPPNPCACYMETKLNGFNALAPASTAPRIIDEAEDDERIVKGPAYSGAFPDDSGPGDWPTYRHDPARSGSASTQVRTALNMAWQAELGGKLTSPVISG